MTEYVNFTVNLTASVVPENYTVSIDEAWDATSPITNAINASSLPPSPASPDAPVNPQAIALQTFHDIQLSNSNSAVFGALTAFSIVILYQSWHAYYQRRKPIYLLNALQTLLLFVKTFAATVYAVMVSAVLSCTARSPLMNIPMVLAWDLIWGIMLIKLLLFTEWKKTCKVVIGLGALAHFAVVVAGVIMRKSKITALGLCADKYPTIFKHQYDIEVGIVYC